MRVSHKVSLTRLRKFYVLQVSILLLFGLILAVILGTALISDDKDGLPLLEQTTRSTCLIQFSRDWLKTLSG